MKTKNQNNFTQVFGFMQYQAEILLLYGCERSSETCLAALRSFKKFRNDKELDYNALTDHLIRQYEAWLKMRGLSRNTSSFYMRQLRTYYNKAVEYGLIRDKKPFRHVYTGVDKTVKRAISYNDLRQIKLLNLVDVPHLAYARDLFLMSFYLRGMSFIDMAYLRKKDLLNGTLTYRRRKTGQLLTIAWTDKMQQIVEAYPVNPTPYLLPIILSEHIPVRQQYRNAIIRVNRALKKVGKMAGVKTPVSTYTARHSWASVAQEMKVDLPIISRGLGHENESTTRIYLMEISNSEVDRANQRIMDGL